jgi:DNA processing protein
LDEKLRMLLLLNTLDGQGRKLWAALKKGLASPDDLWRCDPKLFAELELTEKAIFALRSRIEKRWPENEIEKCIKLGIRTVCIDDEDYPAGLKDLKDPPLALYWRGKEKSLPVRCAGVVGTRNASAYGRRIALKIGGHCASAGIAVISGGASGVDGNAHRGACISGGKTFAVFGTGVDVYFPRSNETLFEEIMDRGALISEFPVGSEGEQWHFPRRNRIVAAVSSKLIVVEAPRKSGAMITAGLAAELGREVWSVPGRIDEENASGSNRLIFDGAHPLTDLRDFFGMSGTGTSARSGMTERAMEEIPLSSNEREILKVLRSVGGQTVDNIALEVKMSAADILKTIAILSAKGIICSSGSGRFSVKV